MRREQAAQTHSRILDAVEAIFIDEPDAILSFDHVAARAGVDRRTVFRHFPSKEALLDAFWTRIGERVGRDSWPRSLSDLTRLPPQIFAELDRIAGIVRAAHVSAAGRELRLRQNGERRQVFRDSLAPLLKNLPETRRREVEAVVQLLFSATAYQTISDYWEMSGAEAGRAVAWAIGALLAALRAETHAGPSRNDPEIAMNATVQHRTATHARTLWVLGDRVTILGPVAGSDLVAAEVVVPPGSGTPLHTHSSPETFLVLEGAISFLTAINEANNARPGDMVTVPANAPHGYRNTGSAPARLLVTFAPSLLAFFEAVGRSDAPPPGPPPAETVAAVMRAAAQHGIRMVETV